mmetsp:Transcript_64867/g.173901  ORF Transcript_64867/g.173901 Transcript_64867/m.173901 type:complete len:182 (-) Transcript_64867:303-848(-)
MRVLSIVAFGAIARGPTEDAAGSDTSCYTTSDSGVSYRGLVDHTKSGRTCQMWTSQHPHHINIADVDEDEFGVGGHNFCRNPNSEMSEPWCYTMDSAMEKETCNIKECPADNEISDLNDVRSHLETAMNWHDCECADQLFGSTETTVDTSVPGDFLQKQAQGGKRNRKGRLVNGKCECKHA